MALYGDVFLTEEAVSVGVIPRLHFRERKRNNFAIQQRDDPANRANETRAVRAGPIHRARPGDFLNRLRQNFGQNLRRRSADHYLLRAEIFALRRIYDAQFRNWNSLFLCEAHRCACRLADIVVGY